MAPPREMVGEEHRAGRAFDAPPDRVTAKAAPPGPSPLLVRQAPPICKAYLDTFSACFRHGCKVWQSVYTYTPYLGPMRADARIPVSMDTLDRLAELAGKRHTYDETIRRLMIAWEHQRTTGERTGVPMELHDIALPRRA